MENLIERLSEILLNNGDSAVIADTDIVLDVADELIDLGYDIEETDIDNDDYEESILLLSRVGKYFILESPFKDDLELLDIESNLIVVQEDLLDEDELDSLGCHTLIIFGIDETIHDECEECCGGCQCDCCKDEIEEEDQPYEDLHELIEEYTEEILEANGCPQCTEQALLEFAVEVLERFRVEKIK